MDFWLVQVLRLAGLCRPGPLPQHSTLPAPFLPSSLLPTRPHPGAARASPPSSYSSHPSRQSHIVYLCQTHPTQALRVQADVFRRNAEQLAAEGDEDDVALVGAVLDVSECCGRVQEVRTYCSRDWLPVGPIPHVSQCAALVWGRCVLSPYHSALFLGRQRTCGLQHRNRFSALLPLLTELPYPAISLAGSRPLARFHAAAAPARRPHPGRPGAAGTAAGAAAGAAAGKRRRGGA